MVTLSACEKDEKSNEDAFMTQISRAQHVELFWEGIRKTYRSQNGKNYDDLVKNRKEEWLLVVSRDNFVKFDYSLHKVAEGRVCIDISNEGSQWMRLEKIVKFFDQEAEKMEKEKKQKHKEQ